MAFAPSHGTLQGHGSGRQLTAISAPNESSYHCRAKRGGEERGEEERGEEERGGDEKVLKMPVRRSKTRHVKPPHSRRLMKSGEGR